MGAVRETGGKKMFWRQGQALRNNAAVREPDNTVSFRQSLHCGTYRGGQFRHREEAVVLPPGKTQQLRAFHLHGEVLWHPFRKFQHHVDGFQAERYGLRAGQLDHVAVNENIAGSSPKLAQHGVQACVGDLQIGTPEFLSHQHGKLPALNTAQLSQNSQDVFLLNG